MEGTEQHSNNAPIVRRSCGCPCGSKNQVSAMQVPTQEGDRREEFNSKVALTQPVQGAQHARVKNINPRAPKLTQKPTKVTTTKKFRKKEELVPSTMMEKVETAPMSTLIMSIVAMLTLLMSTL
ncbi:hypothetical protein DSO57_1017885 [Entomophthora muscae]|uniref:Uncharacterized protein n=1 Tax=Entomophthora muscae TaxID=34485 RepID=A0ACC2UDQ6_9FUNG|nr:hypothetical protein DSO57_1017885 [Entomophthora muscae]